MNLTLPRLRRSKPSVIPTVILLGVILASPNAAQSAIHSWTGSNGEWTTASWSNGVPIISGTAYINNGSTISIPLGKTGTYRTLRIGTASGGGGEVQVNGFLSGTNASLGYVAGATGSATVTSGTWKNTNLYVGNSGTGILTVNSGLVVTSSNGYVGTSANSHGSVTVTSGTLSYGSDLYVGSSGTGTLTVNGGLVTGSIGYLGYVANSHGSATVTSGTWSNTIVYVGKGGTGTLELNGGTVITAAAYIGDTPRGHGSVTVTSGTLSISSFFTVGDQGTGTLELNGGTISNSAATYIGYYGGNGSVTVTSGTWSAANVYVGFDGTGMLTIDGGIVRTGTTSTGSNTGGNGTITLSGDEEGRGVLEAIALAKGTDKTAAGKVHFDGGIIRALQSNGDFISRYSAGDVTLESGGAFVDTNGFAVGITALLGGEGALHKIGEGVLTLGGSNSYTGGTVIENGTLIAAHNHAVGTGSITIQSGGAFTIQSGVTLANAIVLEGGTANRELGNGSSLAGALNASTTLGGATTSALILGGTTSAVTTLQASFSAASGAENDNQWLGGVLHLSGVHVINIGTGETDQFVLQLQVAGVTTENFLGWLDTKTNQWVNAVAGNIGGTATFVGDRAFDAKIDFHLGTYGVDTVNGTVWAVLNHNSDFAVVPEPSTWTILVLGAAGLVLKRRWKREAA